MKCLEIVTDRPTPETVKMMMKHKGVYLLYDGDLGNPKGMVVIASEGGKLHVMEPTMKLHPSDFINGQKVIGPLLTPNLKGD